MAAAAPAAAPAGLRPLSPPPAAAPAPGRPVGKVRSPGLVLLLTLVTLGIYSWFWWWSISKETDAHLQRRHAHPLVRLGIFLGLGALVLYVLGFVLFAGGIAAAASGSTSGFAAAGIGGLLVLFLAAAVALGAGICLLVGAWRIWSVLRDREKALGAAKPLSPGWQLAFYLIPYVNIVTCWVAMYRTQSHLNAMWQGGLVQ